jgi:hypothetical protein
VKLPLSPRIQRNKVENDFLERRGQWVDDQTTPKNQRNLRKKTKMVLIFNVSVPLMLSWSFDYFRVDFVLNIEYIEVKPNTHQRTTQRKYIHPPINI